MSGEFSPQIKSQREKEDRQNVFTIPPGVPFLRTLAEAILDGRFYPELDLQNNPLSLSEAIIFLPTRRAARGLGVELLEAAQSRFGLNSLILPRIRTIGDLDDEETYLSLNPSQSECLEALPEAGNVISSIERQMVLARLVKGWTENLSGEKKQLLDHEQIVMPSSAGDALYLASDLARFLDQIETEEADWSKIRNIVDNGDFSSWWELTLEFLEIIVTAWPNYLEAGHQIGPAEFRTRVIDYRISQLGQKPSKGFILAAGTTGSIPATSRLLAAIKELPNGAIVLPGVDRHLPTEIVTRFYESSELGEEGITSTHPQFGLVKLLHKLKTKPKDVAVLGKANQVHETREAIINTVLLPAEDSQSWIATTDTHTPESIANAFDNVSIVEAASEHDEAMAIALMLRETLETSKKSAALVTPNRKLARRVSAELERFNIQIDDSAGSPLLAAKPIVFLRQLLRAVFDKDDALNLSSFLKNDLLVLGYQRYTLLEEFELLELLLVRDMIQPVDLAKLPTLISLRKKEIEQDKYAPKRLKALADEKWAKLLEIGTELSETLEKLLVISQSDAPQTPAGLIAALAECAEKLTAEPLTADEGTFVHLYAGAGGEETQNFLSSHRENDDVGFSFQSDEAIAVFDALVSGHRIRDTGRTRPRLHIFGTLEARLQSSDLVILGSLNEGIWPQTYNNDPYLNRPMRSQLALPLPERRIGLAAHDFSQLSGAKEVVYTRSKRIEDAPAIASRWLQRLTTYLGKEETGKLTARGDRYLKLAMMADQPENSPYEISRPAPKPPVAARPKKLSITEIETWIRDPYAIYARHILNLEALPSVLRDTDPALRGTIYHNILANFVESWTEDITDAAFTKLADIADTEFANHNLPAEILAIWRPRFTPIGEAFLKWHGERQHQIEKSFCEIALKGEIEDTGFTLTGRADRIDLNKEGGLTIIDYKTGNSPSKPQARTLSPQLSLEGAMAARGFTSQIPQSVINELLYVRLQQGSKFKIDDLSSGKDKKGNLWSASELAEHAFEELKNHIIAYQSPEQSYQSQYAPQPNRSYAGDYDYLARIREWSLSDGETDEGDEK